jgi:transmembrane sensor
VVVNYTEHERRLDLQQGEALFEVAKDPARPFIVIAGDRQVRALGTAFVVRRDERQLAVTLIEGKVAVASVTLAPGQRLTLANQHAPTLDRPSIDKVTAWRRGQIELEQATLADAIVEMNRYSAIKLAIESPEAAALRVNGVFRAGDTAGFAAAVARAYGLTVEHRSEQLLLTGAPAAAALTETPAP